MMRRIDLAPIRGNVRLARPFVLTLDELDSIAPLLIAEHFRRCPWQLPLVIRTDGVRRPCCRRTVKEKNHPRNLVQLDEIRALVAQLAGAKEIAPARRECTTAARNIETVEARQTEALVEKLVGLLLKTTVGARDDKCMRAVRGPLA